MLLSVIHGAILKRWIICIASLSISAFPVSWWKIPKRTDRVYYGDFRFEVIDVDNNKIDSIIVTPVKKEPDMKNDLTTPDLPI